MKHFRHDILAPARKAKAFLKRVAVRMLADGTMTFVLVFLTASGAISLWQLMPWISGEREGVTDMDPLFVLMVAFALAIGAASIRYNLMKKFSGIRP